MLAYSFNPEDFLIFVVDDLPQNLKLVGNLLNEVGYSTTFATSGKQVLERIPNCKPDLILLDLMIPDIDGLEICKILKTDPNYQEIPIIFLTVSHDPEHLLDAFNSGAVDYITKPFRKLELLVRVKTHLMLKHTKDELKKALVELSRIARIDPLTGIWNRRSFFEAVEQELKQSLQEESSFFILLLDVDYFKRINDNYGHRVGDRALIALTSVISDALRSEDIFGRYGGEEFAILLRKTDQSAAFAVAERLRNLVAEISLSVDREPVRMTVSIGIAGYKSTDRVIDDIFQRADRALYQAKAQGRNTCCLL